MCFSSLSLLSLTTNSSPVFFFTSQNPLFLKFFSFSFFFLRIFLCVFCFYLCCTAMAVAEFAATSSTSYTKTIPHRYSSQLSYVADHLSHHRRISYSRPLPRNQNAKICCSLTSKYATGSSFLFVLNYYSCY